MTEEPNAKDVVITRTFNSSIDAVWRMWVEADQFQKWYGPEGAAIPVADMDVRVGGKRLICMEVQTPNGPMKMWLAGEYLVIDSPARLEYTEFMSDENGNALPLENMPPGTSGSTTVVVELVDKDGATEMTMTHKGVPADSPGAVGWNMAIDKLESLV